MVKNTFTERVQAAIAKTNSHLCLGLDPIAKHLPAEYSAEPSDLIDSYREFCFELLELAQGFVPIFKPQSAYFEKLGSAGVQLYEEIANRAKALGMLVIGDLKRGDIGSTAAAYADAVFDSPSMPTLDAVTVNPYMGSDSVLPFADKAHEVGGAVFVLVKTSNPSFADFQNIVAGDQKIYEHVVSHLNRWNARYAPDDYGDLGAVVGATHGELLSTLRRLMPKTWFLIPGVGAQGGTMDDAAFGFDEEGSGALVNMSRALCYPWSYEADVSAPSLWREMIAESIQANSKALNDALHKRSQGK